MQSVLTIGFKNKRRLTQTHKHKHIQKRSSTNTDRKEKKMRFLHEEEEKRKNGGKKTEIVIPVIAKIAEGETKTLKTEDTG